MFAASSLGACGAERDRCGTADLAQSAPQDMPVVVRITHTRRLVKARLDPLPASVRPAVTAGEAWERLRRQRQPLGGGQDELLFGLFTGQGVSHVRAWVLMTSHVAQRVDPVTSLPSDPSSSNVVVCGFLDVATALNATTGASFYGSTAASAGPRPHLSPGTTTRSQTQPPPGT